jgi:hypothetical protein
MNNIYNDLVLQGDSPVLTLNNRRQNAYSPLRTMRFRYEGRHGSLKSYDRQPQEIRS